MGQLIDGKLISDLMMKKYKDVLSNFLVKGKKCVCADILVGDDPSSLIYHKSKMKRLTEIGIEFNSIILKKDIQESELQKVIYKLNDDKSINAIFIDLPLPKHIDEIKIINSINPYKDVEGFNMSNLGSLLSGGNCFFPCTAEGIVTLLKKSNITISGKNVVIVGRSNVVGKPLSMLLLRENATVTICHSKTINLPSICKNADILITAIGKPRFINSSYIKENAVVIDAGINRIEIDGKNTICGDVDFNDAMKIASFITPVPGGVGPMTIATLVEHCIRTIKNG